MWWHPSRGAGVADSDDLAPSQVSLASGETQPGTPAVAPGVKSPESMTPPATKRARSPEPPAAPHRYMRRPAAAPAPTRTCIDEAPVAAAPGEAPAAAGEPPAGRGDFHVMRYISKNTAAVRRRGVAGRPGAQFCNICVRGATLAQVSEIAVEIVRQLEAGLEEDQALLLLKNLKQALAKRVAEGE